MDLSSRQHKAARKLAFWGVFAVFITTGTPTETLRASSIPYYHPSSFLQNPFGEVSLPPLPDVLRPFGPPKATPPPRDDAIVAKLPTTQPGVIPAANADIPQSAATDAALADENADAAGKPDQSHTTTAAPFLNWVENNKNATAAAQAERERYKNSAAPSSDSDNDLMLNIRYPYTWSQETPPGGGSVTYSIPKR